MSVEEDCIHGAWPPTSCTLCSGKVARERREAEEEARTVQYKFTAKFPGACTKYGENFDSGEPVAKMGNDLIYCGDCAGIS